MNSSGYVSGKPIAIEFRLRLPCRPSRMNRFAPDSVREPCMLLVKTFHIFVNFLPRNARSAKRGIATLNRPYVCNVDVPSTYRLE